MFSHGYFQKFTKKYEKMQIYCLKIILSTNNRKKSSASILIADRMISKSYVDENFLPSKIAKN